MELKERSQKFMVEFIALCERHGAAVLTDGPEPSIIFTSRENLTRYLEWWVQHGSILESEDFTDHLP